MRITTSFLLLIFAVTGLGYASIQDITQNVYTAENLHKAGYTTVTTLNGSSLPWTFDKDGTKIFHLTAEPVKREFAPGMIVDCWGYNGSTPGPTIEAIEGDRVKILVTNHLPEPTTIHWHGIFLPNGMDGVGGLTQKRIQPGETYVYEFTLHQTGTFMYHPHVDETLQMALGMMGFFIIHPKNPQERKVDRDYCILVQGWYIDPGTFKPNPAVMTDFNTWTFNSKVYPATQVMVARTGERIRIRLGNLSMTNHPIHIHGYAFNVTGTDGGWIPKSAQWPETTIDVPPGAARVGEFMASAPGDWAFHCHKPHHTMGPMRHDYPVLTGVNQNESSKRIQELMPEADYMPTGSSGSADMAAMAMPNPPNTLPMMTGQGPFGPIGMGGMFTLFKVRDNQAPNDYNDPGWYTAPAGTRAYLLATPPSVH
ncbi:MAG TPA: copper oxidase [Opitutales bacterium]|nr:copper oxidase [Opitutales bacterium]